MKLTKKKLQEIIKEELDNLNEDLFEYNELSDALEEIISNHNLSEENKNEAQKVGHWIAETLIDVFDFSTANTKILGKSVINTLKKHY